MDVLFEKILMGILLWILKLVDSIFEVFKQLAGIEPVNVRGEDTDIVSVFLGNEAISNVFFGILIIAAVVCAIAMIVAIVKNFINMNGGERKSIAKISGQGLGTIFITLAMAGILMSGVFIANSFLQDVHYTFKIDDQTLGNEIFKNSVEGYTLYIPIYDDEATTDIKESEDNPVWEVDENGEYVLDENGNKIPKIFGYKIDSGDSGWVGKKEDFNLYEENPDSILGIRETNFIGLEKAHKEPYTDYWLKLGSFNYVVGFFSAVIILIAVGSACLGLIKRLYDIVILFLSLPLIVSTIPLDDGARFKVWRETVISKVIIAYGAVFAVNVFLLMMPIIGTIGENTILKMLLIVGGGLSINGGILLFARLFGTDAAESRELAQSARTLLIGAGATGKIFSYAKNKANATVNRLFPASGNKSSQIENLNTQNAIGRNSTDKSGFQSSQAMPGSELGEAMRTAGLQPVLMGRDKNGRFMSPSQIQDRLNAAKK